MLFCFLDLPPGFASSEASFQKALQLKQQGHLAEAESELKRAVAQEPANADYHFELANVYAMRFDSARKVSKAAIDRQFLELAGYELEQATTLKPDFVAAHYNLGVVYKRMERFEEARQQFREALRYQPANAGAQMQLGAVYEEQGFWDEAEDAYRKAREMDYGNVAIDEALEDLKKHRGEVQHRSLLQDQSAALDRMRQGWQYAPGSNLGQIAAESQNAQSAGPLQAIPYLGSWLIQEFMKAREPHQSSE